MTDIGFDDRQRGRPSDAPSAMAPEANAPGGPNGRALLDDRLLATIARTIQFEIVPRLLMATRGNDAAQEAKASDDTISAAEVDDFIQTIMFRDVHVAMVQIRSLRERDLSGATIFLDLLAPTARQLGDLWLRDQCSFADVTIGLVRLQQIMRSLSPPVPHDGDPSQRQPRVLLMPFANEQHTLGLSVVKEMLLEAGWRVELVNVSHMGQAAELVRAGWYDLVGVSLSNDDLLAQLTSAISAMRGARRINLLAFLLGEPPSTEGLTGVHWSARMARLGMVGRLSVWPVTWSGSTLQARQHLHDQSDRHGFPVRSQQRSCPCQRQGPNALVGLDGRTAVAVASVVADIVMLVDGKGIVRDLKTNPDTPIAKDAQSWMGRPWLDTIAPDSQNKAINLLSEAATGSASALREINHKGADPLSTIPMRYSAIKAKPTGSVIVVGRDLSALAQVQQQLVQSQQAMERDYLRLRAAETRYRALFQMTSEPILIADMATRKVLEANPAAVDALATSSGRLTGRMLGQLFDDKGAADIDALLSRAAGGQSAVTVRIASATTGRQFDATASLFRNEGATLVLIRLTEVVSTGASAGGISAERYLSLIDKLPDGFVVTDLEGHVVEANPAFLELAQLATADQAKGRQLGEWLGRAGIDVPTMTATLRDYGSLRSFSTIMRGTFGLVESVEVSAVLVETSEFPCYGFVIRSVARPTAAANGTKTQVLPRSVDQFTELVGRVSLKELVRETTDIIERLCIEAALEMTQDNRATAAELLGLSRQSLYLKMRRFGIMDEAGAR